MSYAASVVGAVAGAWVGSCLGFLQVRVRCTAYTSGSATAVLSATRAPLEPAMVVGGCTALLVTVTAASGAIATLTLPAPGAGLRQYITYLAVNRFAAAVLTAAAAPVVATTTNLPGAMAFSFPAEAALLGTLFPLREAFAYPLAASAQNTAVTIVGPATTGVIWRISAGYFVAP